jgi:hypothetical protein
MKRNSELSTVALVSISLTFAVIGSLVFAIVTPIPPNKLVSLEHSLVSEATVQ